MGQRDRLFVPKKEVQINKRHKQKHADKSRKTIAAFSICEKSFL